MQTNEIEQLHSDHFHHYRTKDIDFDQLDSYAYFPWMEDLIDFNSNLQIQSLKQHEAYFSVDSFGLNYQVIAIFEKPILSIFCNCQENIDFCLHQKAVLNQIIKKDELRLFFADHQYQKQLEKIAKNYGIEKEQNLKQYFEINWDQNELKILKKKDNLIDPNNSLLESLNSNPEKSSKNYVSPSNFLVIREHKYYKHQQVLLYKSNRTINGGLKNPIEPIDSEEFIWKSKEIAESQFFTALHFLEQNTQEDPKKQLLAFKSLIKNPLSFEVYKHDKSISENISIQSISQVSLKNLPKTIRLEIDQIDNFYTFKGFIDINGESIALQKLTIVYDFFVAINQTLYFVENQLIKSLFKLFKTKEEYIQIHRSKFEDFQQNFLNHLEEIIDITYKFVKKATRKQLSQQHFYTDNEAIIYLEESGDYINLIPTMRYADVEVPMRSRRSVFGFDEEGKKFLVSRDQEAELNILSLIIKQHPYFEEQLQEEFQHFYLHRKHFLDQDWFLNAFEEWRNHQITIIGFNEIKANKINSFKGKINIQVLSGQNWFNADIELTYGKKRASLKNLQKAIRNKSKFVTLDDGTLGILPDEWLSRFEDFFLAGELIDDTVLQIAHTNFSAIDQFFEEQWLSLEAKERLNQIKSKIDHLDGMKSVQISKDFQGVLRTYQQEGLNWLNFLDDFEFGGCLADDMGLGKTIQVIAFILQQRHKVSHNCNLLVLPTTLIFNWKDELEKFAPSINFLILQGPDRQKNSNNFENYELILISYHNLLTDINHLKKFKFNYVFLDESQQIKNPNSQRYQAVMKLQSRNRIVISGTPIENSTMDLFAQLSFSNPGLLGSKKYFKDVYTTPIDGFSNKKRLNELQQKVKPFILRRTKKEVAKELPNKTELVLYCEMKPAQRHIYDLYEKEFRDFISAKDADEIRKSPMHVLKGLTKLRQICNSTKLLKKDDLTLESDSSKIELLVEQVLDKSPYQKIIIFSQFVGMLDLIELALSKHQIEILKLTGKSKNRAQIIKQFQENNSQRVILISLKAGGTGLNLTAANLVYLVDPWWNPAVEMQAIDRAFRIGQTKDVTAIRLICPNTVEDKIMKLQANKTKIADNLISDNESIISDFMDKDKLISLFRQI